MCVCACVCVYTCVCVRVCVNASRKNMFETYRAKSTVIETEKKHVANNRRGLKFFFLFVPVRGERIRQRGSLSSMQSYKKGTFRLLLFHFILTSFSPTAYKNVWVFFFFPFLFWSNVPRWSLIFSSSSFLSFFFFLPFYSDRTVRLIACLSDNRYINYTRSSEL